MGRPYTSFVAWHETPISSDSVLDGDYDFPLNGEGEVGRQILLEYFWFVDGTGSRATATNGTVTVHASSDGGETYGNLVDNSFDASAAEDPARNRSNGVGKATHLRITLTGVTGVAGFRGLAAQGAGA